MPKEYNKGHLPFANNKVWTEEIFERYVKVNGGNQTDFVVNIRSDVLLQKDGFMIEVALSNPSGNSEYKQKAWHNIRLFINSITRVK